MRFGYRYLMGGRKYDPFAAAHFARMSDTSDSWLLNNLETLIIGLQNDAIWDLIDDLCVIHNNDTDSLLGLKGNFDSIKVGTPAFSTATGFTMNKTSDYCIDTNIVQSVGSQIQNDDMHMWALRTAIDVAETSSIVMGAYDQLDTGNNGLYDLAVIADASALAFYATLGNGGTTALMPGSARSVTGFLGATRTSAADVETRSNATNAVYGSLASTHGAPSISITVGARRGRYTSFDAIEPVLANDAFAGWGVGAGLSSTQMSNLRSRIATYMSSRGL